MGHIYKFSYDDRDDAIQSLANYYSVDVEYFKSKLEKIFLYIKNLEDEGFYLDHKDNGMMLNEIRTILNPNLNEISDARIRISFYHRCMSDGTIQWFSEGLLNSFDGIKEFIRKINSITPYKISDKDAKSIYRQLEHRHNLEYFNNKDMSHSGVWGFYKFSYALEIEEYNYDFPEIIQAYIYKDKDLKESLSNSLDVCVVKAFIEKDIKEIDWYLRIYWDILYDEFCGICNFQAEDFGRGLTISQDDIEKIIKISN